MSASDGSLPGSGTHLAISVVRHSTQLISAPPLRFWNQWKHDSDEKYMPFLRLDLASSWVAGGSYGGDMVNMGVRREY